MVHCISEGLRICIWIIESQWHLKPFGYAWELSASHPCNNAQQLDVLISIGIGIVIVIALELFETGGYQASFGGCFTPEQCVTL